MSSLFLPTLSLLCSLKAPPPSGAMLLDNSWEMKEVGLGWLKKNSHYPSCPTPQNISIQNIPMQTKHLISNIPFSLTEICIKRKEMAAWLTKALSMVMAWIGPLWVPQRFQHLKKCSTIRIRVNKRSIFFIKQKKWLWRWKRRRGPAGCFTWGHSRGSSFTRKINMDAVNWKLTLKMISVLLGTPLCTPRDTSVSVSSTAGVKKVPNS